MRILLWHGYLLAGTGSNVYTRALVHEWSRAGHEVVQVYVADPAAAVARPPRELKAFAKIGLEPGGEQ